MAQMSLCFGYLSARIAAQELVRQVGLVRAFLHLTARLSCGSPYFELAVFADGPYTILKPSPNISKQFRNSRL